jgi:hypothetical protein
MNFKTIFQILMFVNVSLTKAVDDNDATENQLYASTQDLANFQQNFVKFLKQIKKENFDVLERLEVDNAAQGFVFLRSVLSDFPQQLSMFGKRSRKTQVILFNVDSLCKLIPT